MKLQPPALIVVFTLVILCGVYATAATKTFTGSGNFSTPANWNNGTLPVADDNLRIDGVCTFDNAAANLAYGTLSVGHGTAGTLRWPSGGTNTLNVTAISSAVAGSAIDMTNGGTLQIRTSWTTANETFTPGQGTVIWNVTGSSKTLPSGILTYNNLTIIAATRTVTLRGATTLNGSLLITSGTLTAGASNFGLTVNGDFTNNGTFTAGSGTVTLSGSSTQSIGGSTTTAFNNLTVANSAAPVALAANINIFGTLTINAGASLIPAAAVVINSALTRGTITGAGTATVTSTSLTGGYASQYKFTTNTLGSLTVDVAGSAAQGIDALTYGSLTLDNPSGATLAGNVTVSGILTLANGVLATGANALSVTNQASDAVVALNGTVNGQIARTIAAGSAGTYLFAGANVWITPDGSQGAVSVTVSAFPATDALNDPSQNAIRRYYLITPSGALNAAVRLSYDNSEVRSGQNEANFTLWHYTGTAWVDQGAILRDTVNNWVEQVGVTSFSPWTISESGSPLPITLATFTAAVMSGPGIRLRWSTISEISNYGFEVQRSANAISGFQSVSGLIPGHGTTNIPRQYTWDDKTAGPGAWYYRLRQIDLDGTEHMSDVISIVASGTAGTHVPATLALQQNYPNPFNPVTAIPFAVEEAGRAVVTVYDITGREVATLFDGVAQPGTLYQVRFDASRLASGVYLYRLQSAGRSEMKRMIVLK